MLVKLTARTATDLYDATGFDTGTQLAITNVGSYDVRVGTSEADAPSGLPVRTDQIVVNEEGDGAWAICVGAGVVDVAEAG